MQIWKQVKKNFLISCYPFLLYLALGLFFDVDGVDKVMTNTICEAPQLIS